MKKIAILIPCFNESDLLYDTYVELNDIIKSLIDVKHVSSDSFLVFIDDGSTDDTWGIIMSLVKSKINVKGLKLSRNFGHQNALLSGLLTFKEHFDAAITIDADLQDDPSVIPQMITFLNNGNDIVYGVRKSRMTDSFFKRNSAKLFYKLMNLLGVVLVYNHADFRLISSRVVNCLNSFNESNLFLRGIIPFIGYNSQCVYYDRRERSKGVSKYPLFKMLSFAFDGITSFSIKPLRVITSVGLLFFFFSLAYITYVLYLKYTGNVVQGWTSLIASIYFIAGINLFFLGLVGEYVGRIYKEVKSRPKYFVEEII